MGGTLANCGRLGNDDPRSVLVNERDVKNVENLLLRLLEDSSSSM